MKGRDRLGRVRFFEVLTWCVERQNVKIWIVRLGMGTIYGWLWFLSEHVHGWAPSSIGRLVYALGILGGGICSCLMWWLGGIREIKVNKKKWSRSFEIHRKKPCALPDGASGTLGGYHNPPLFMISQIHELLMGPLTWRLSVLSFHRTSCEMLLY